MVSWADSAIAACAQLDQGVTNQTAAEVEVVIHDSAVTAMTFGSIGSVKLLGADTCNAHDGRYGERLFHNAQQAANEIAAIELWDSFANSVRAEVDTDLDDNGEFSVAKQRPRPPRPLPCRGCFGRDAQVQCVSCGDVFCLDCMGTCVACGFFGCIWTCMGNHPCVPILADSGNMNDSAILADSGNKGDSAILTFPKANVKHSAQSVDNHCREKGFLWVD